MLSNGVSNQLLSTEDLIKEKAKVFFLVQGQINATSQEIADFAGVKRTLVNYYFRSKENLLQIVCLEVIQNMKLKLDTIYLSDLSFDEKLNEIIDYNFALRQQYPFLEIVKTIEVAQKMQNKSSFLNPVQTPGLKVFLKEIAEEIKAKRITDSNPLNFLLNIQALISYPLMMKPIYSELYELSNEEYDLLVKERKDLIKQLVYKK